MSSDAYDVLDALPSGAVIHWVNNGRFNYVALKVSNWWYTSATESNHYCPQIVTSCDLADILKDTAIDVVKVWRQIHAPWSAPVSVVPRQAGKSRRRVPLDTGRGASGLADLQEQQAHLSDTS